MNPIQSIMTEITQLEQLFSSILGGGGASSPGNLNSSGSVNSPDLNFGFQCGNNFENPWTDFANLGSLGSNFSADLGQNGPGYKTEIKDGQQLIDLGNYTLGLDESSSQWTLTNKTTGTATKVWGDPHVQGAGSNFDFHKPLTFMLDDGTQITCKTVPWGNGGATVSSELDITDGYGRACKVTGLAQSGAAQNDGGLTITGAGDGTRLNPWEMAAANADTPVVYEIPGGGWSTQGGTRVDSQYAAANL